MLSTFIHRIPVAALLLAVIAAGPAQADPGGLDPRVGHVVFEVVGQVNNSAQPAPLGSSQQFGYLSFVEGLDQVFTTDDPAHQNESTAMFTFFTDVTTTRVTGNGPLTIIIREGTTTIYRNTGVADFSVPDSFHSGEPVVASTIRQQVILDAVEKTFTVTSVNSTTDAARFELDGRSLRLGHRGDVLRTSLVGVLKTRDGVPPPTGYFSGTVVAAAPSASR